MILSYVDPHRVTALKLDGAMREMREKLEELKRVGDGKADAGRMANEAVTELEQKLKKTSDKKEEEKRSARRRELSVGVAAVLLTLLVEWDRVVWLFSCRSLGSRGFVG
jgi:exopolyphosphatase/pppGpp-phosphohydrolase